MTNDRLRVGLVGLGTMGRNHLRNLLARDDVTLVAIADPLVDAREAAAEMAPAARTFVDIRELIEEEELDALIVAVPTMLHHAIAMAAIERRVAVLVEKPIAASVAEADELVRAARSRGVLLQVGHIERFNPVVVALGERLRERALSRIFGIRTVRGGPLPDRIRDVGVAIDLATHDVDLICHLLGERPVRAYAETTRHVHTAHEDLLYGLLAFPSGALAQIDVNWLTPEKQRRITVLGEEGMFQLDLLAQTLTFTRGPKDLEPTYLGGFAPTFEGTTVTLPVVSVEPLRLELDAFLGSVRSRVAPTVTAEEGRWALSLAKLLLASATQGRPFSVEASGTHP